MKNILSALFCLALAFLCVFIPAAPAKANGVTYIYNAENFLSMESGNYEMANDIDLSSVIDFAGLLRFSGTFNGAGYKLHKLNINNAHKFSLFGDLENASIKNLIIEDFRVYAINSCFLFADDIYSSTLENIELRNVEIISNEGSLFCKTITSTALINISVSSQQSSVLSYFLYQKIDSTSSVTGSYFLYKDVIYDFFYNYQLAMPSVSALLSTLPNVNLVTVDNFSIEGNIAASALSYGFSEYEAVISEIEVLYKRLADANDALLAFLSQTFPENFLETEVSTNEYNTAFSYLSNLTSENKTAFEEKEAYLVQILFFQSSFKNILEIKDIYDRLTALKDLLPQLTGEDDINIISELIENTETEIAEIEEHKDKDKDEDNNTTEPGGNEDDDQNTEQGDKGGTGSKEDEGNSPYDGGNIGDDNKNENSDGEKNAEPPVLNISSDNRSTNKTPPFEIVLAIAAFTLLIIFGFNFKKKAK